MRPLFRKISLPANFVITFTPVGVGELSIADLTITVQENDVVIAHPEKTFTVPKAFTAVGVFSDRILVGDGLTWLDSFYFISTKQLTWNSSSIEKSEGLELDLRLYRCNYHTSLTVLADGAASLNIEWQYLKHITDEVELPNLDFTGDFCVAVSPTALRGTLLECEGLKLEVVDNQVECTFGTDVISLTFTDIAKTISLDRFGDQLTLGDGFNRAVKTVNTEVVISGLLEVGSPTVVAFSPLSVCRGMNHFNEVPKRNFNYTTYSPGSNLGTSHSRFIVGFFGGSNVSMTPSLYTDDLKLHVGGAEPLDLTQGLFYSVVAIKIEDGYEVWVNRKYIGVAESEPASLIVNGSPSFIAVNDNYSEAVIL